MKTFITYLGIIAIALMIFNCSKDDAITVVPDRVQEIPEQEEPTPRVTLNSISPTSGPKETLVSLRGENFGSDLTKVQVFFNDKAATIQSLTDDEITVIVPPKAFSGSVKVKVDEAQLVGPEFTYLLTDIQVSTLVGSTNGYADGFRENAQFNYPHGIAKDAQGNLYVTDTNNNRVRMITSSGVVSTLTGSDRGHTDGTIGEAKFYQPNGIVIDAEGSLYISDSGNHRIRKLFQSGEVVTLAGSDQGLADGAGATAKFSYPNGIAIDPDGIIYVADANNHRIRKIMPDGEVSTFAGSTAGFANGTGKNAQFNFPRGIALDAEGNIWVADTRNYKIRKITPSGVVSTVVGQERGSSDGTTENATFNDPTGLVVGPRGTIYLTDSENDRIRKIAPNGIVSTLAGSDSGNNDGPGASSNFSYPTGIMLEPNGDLLIADGGNGRIRKITQE